MVFGELIQNGRDLGEGVVTAHRSLPHGWSERHGKAEAGQPLLDAVLQVFHRDTKTKPGLGHANDVFLGRDHFDLLGREFGGCAACQVKAQSIHGREGSRVFDGDHNQAVGFGFGRERGSGGEPLEGGG